MIEVARPKEELKRPLNGIQKLREALGSSVLNLLFSLAGDEQSQNQNQTLKEPRIKEFINSLVNRVS